MVTNFTWLQKSAYPGVPPGGVRHFDPKIHKFAQDSLLTGCVHRYLKGIYVWDFWLTYMFSSVLANFTRLKKVCPWVGTSVFFDISTLKFTGLLRVPFYPSVYIRGPYRCTYRRFLYNIYVCFRIHLFHEAIKRGHLAVHPGVFRHGDPKIHCFSTCSLLYGNLHSWYDRCA